MRTPLLWFVTRRVGLVALAAALLASAALAPDAAAQDAPRTDPANPQAPKQDAPPKEAPKPDAAKAPAPPVRQPDAPWRSLDDYKINVGDEVEIVVHQPGQLQPVLSRILTVPANGVVSMPPVGKVELRGRTVTQIEELVARRLKEENYLTAPNVACVVIKYTPRYVSVIGAVRKNVALPIHRDMRIIELLAELGELDSEGADFTRVTIRRVAPDGTSFPIPVDVDAVFNGKDDNANLVLKPGDFVQIPRLESVTSPQASDFVFVLGKVRTPGRIPMARGRFTITRLIAVCGDFSEFANRSAIRVIRNTPTGREIIEVDMDDVLKLKAPDIEMKPDDLVYVPESFF